MDLGEKYIRYVIESILNTHYKDLELFSDKLKHLQSNNENINLIKDLEKIKSSNFKIMKFKDAISYLKTVEEELEQKPNYDEYLSHEMEPKLVNNFGPIFITHCPNHLKSFYMRIDDDDPITCQSFDLLLPRKRCYTLSCILSKLSILIYIIYKIKNNIYYKLIVLHDI